MKTWLKISNNLHTMVACGPSLPVVSWAWIDSRLCEHTNYKGIRIVDPSDKMRLMFSDLVLDALGFIEEHDPTWLARVQKEISIIYHLPVVRGCEYERLMKVVLVDGKAFRFAKQIQGSIGMLACFMIHAATKGYFYSRIRCSDENELRINACAFDAMKAFAAKAAYDLPPECAEPGPPPSFAQRVRFFQDRIREL